MKKYEFVINVGLFDKDAKKQIVSNADAKSIISKILLNDYNIGGFTILDCNGVYTMEDNTIIEEPSLQIVICATKKELTKENFRKINLSIKKELNQESVLTRIIKSKYDFI